MNTTNANQILGFDKFSESNYNLHWSFSNFNRMLMVAGHIAQLPLDSKVLELGAGSSDLENLVKKNFGRSDIKFLKIDGDNQYESDEKITVLDITSEKCKVVVEAKGPYDAVVFMEVIEHIDSDNDVDFILDYIYANLKKEGLLLLTTPTPPIEGIYEDRVWPLDHKREFTYSQIYDIINKRFKINKQIGWSLEEREYNQLLESDENVMKTYTKLKGAFPESYIRAIIACISPVQANRQVLLICKGRRETNGRFTQT